MTKQSKMTQEQMQSKVWFFITWTPITLKKQKFFDFCKKFTGDALVSEEYSKRRKRHFHAVYSVSNMVKIADKELMRDHIYQELLEDGQEKGHKTLDIQLVRDADFAGRVASYVVKDQEYMHTQIFDDYIMDIVANSYKKTTPTEDIRILINELKEKSLLPDGVTKKDIQKLHKDILIQKAKAGHEVYPLKVEAMMRGVMIDIENSIADQIVKESKLYSCYNI